MTAFPTVRRFSLEEYFDLEERSQEKHEYRDGYIVQAMAGGTGNHSLITINISGEVRNALKGKPCRVYESNLRVGTSTGRYVYPDASVICEGIQYDPADRRQQTALNPRVVIEVLSPSTEGYDRGDRFKHYLQIDSFREYVLVSQQAPVVETFTRQDDGSWSFRIFQGLHQSVRLQSLGMEVPLAEIFAGVDFTQPAADDALR